MVLTKKSLFLIFSILALLLMPGNLFAQLSEEPFNKGTTLFRKLEQVQNDSAQYARQLYTLSQYCRELGMYEESRFAALKASKIMSSVLKKKEPKSETDYALYEEELDMNLFLLDLLTGRGDQYLELSQLSLLLDASSTIIAGYRVADGILAGKSQEELRPIYQKWSYPRLEHLNVITRYFWETGKTDQLIKEIGKAQRKPDWFLLPESDRNELSRRMENACLLPYLNLSTLNECLRFAKDMYYPASAKDILYAQKMPEYFSMYREAARTCVKIGNPLYALKVYQLIERLIVRCTEKDYPFLLPFEQHNLWEIMQPYFYEMQTFAYENRDLDGMVSFLYHNILLMKELFAKPLFQYHHYLSDNNRTTIMDLQSKIDSVTFDGNTFKVSIPEERIKWLKNKVLSREYEKTLVNHVRGGASPQSLRVRHWNEIAASLDSHEAVIEMMSLPYQIAEEEYIGIVFTKYNSPRLVTLPRGTALMTMDSEELYQQVWLPLKKLLGECTHLYISSEGALKYFTFESLYHKDYSVFDEYEFHYLFSSNDIPRIKSEQLNGLVNSHKRKMYLFGGIDYNAHSSSSQHTAQQGFQYLQGTANEVKSIERILSANRWNIHEYMGKNATDIQFRNISGDSLSAAVIHIATHGLVIPYHPEVKSDAVQVNGYSGQRDLMLHSCLTFAGANQSWNNQSPIRIDDGILTAFEISSMNLSGTELVVLSGCLTGKGNVRYGEGAFGLSRAFRQAGVKSQIISFNTVSDKNTADLMADFYRYWQEGASKHQAFRQAQQNMKKRFPFQPEKWASFILIE